MDILSAFFRKPEAETKVLIDIGARSVAGGYVHTTAGQLPTLLYTRRLPIEIRDGEPHAQAMLRALIVLGEALIREGAPTLARTTGSGTAGSILVSIDAPWQQTSVRTEHFEGEKPFIFTKSLVHEALKKAECATPGKILCDEGIIGTLLNGYPTHNPYNKKTQRAAVVVLTSLVEQAVAESISHALSNLYHTRQITLIAGSSLRYQAIRIAFPHEHNLLILDATAPLVSISLIRKDMLIALSERPDGTVGDAEWVTEVSKGFDELAKHNPLPPIIFLLTREGDTEVVEKALAAAKLGSLWLSDNPPKIIPILPTHLSSSARQADAVVPDLPLLLMAIYASRQELL